MSKASEFIKNGAPEWRIVSMTGQRPVRIDQRVWPTIASHTWLTTTITGPDGTEYESGRVRSPDLTGDDYAEIVQGPGRSIYYTATVRQGPTGWLVYGTAQDVARDERVKYVGFFLEWTTREHVTCDDEMEEVAAAEEKSLYGDMNRVVQLLAQPEELDHFLASMSPRNL